MADHLPFLPVPVEDMVAGRPLAFLPGYLDACLCILQAHPGGRDEGPGPALGEITGKGGPVLVGAADRVLVVGAGFRVLPGKGGPGGMADHLPFLPVPVEDMVALGAGHGLPADLRSVRFRTDGGDHRTGQVEASLSFGIEAAGIFLSVCRDAADRIDIALAGFHRGPGPGGSCHVRQGVPVFSGVAEDPVGLRSLDLVPGDLLPLCGGRQGDAGRRLQELDRPALVIIAAGIGLSVGCDAADGEPVGPARLCLFPLEAPLFGIRQLVPVLSVPDKDPVGLDGIDLVPAEGNALVAAGGPGDLGNAHEGIGLVRGRVAAHQVLFIRGEAADRELVVGPGNGVGIVEGGLRRRPYSLPDPVIVGVDHVVLGVLDRLPLEPDAAGVHLDRGDDGRGQPEAGKAVRIVSGLLLVPVQGPDRIGIGLAYLGRIVGIGDLRPLDGQLLPVLSIVAGPVDHIALCPLDRVPVDGQAFLGGLYIGEEGPGRRPAHLPGYIGVFPADQVIGVPELAGNIDGNVPGIIKDVRAHFRHVALEPDLFQGGAAGEAAVSHHIHLVGVEVQGLQGGALIEGLLAEGGELLSGKILQGRAAGKAPLGNVRVLGVPDHLLQGRAVLESPLMDLGDGLAQGHLRQGRQPVEGVGADPCHLVSQGQLSDLSPEGEPGKVGPAGAGFPVRLIGRDLSAAGDLQGRPVEGPGQVRDLAAFGPVLGIDAARQAGGQGLLP